MSQTIAEIEQELLEMDFKLTIDPHVSIINGKETRLYMVLVESKVYNHMGYANDSDCRKTAMTKCLQFAKDAMAKVRQEAPQILKPN